MATTRLSISETPLDELLARAEADLANNLMPAEIFNSDAVFAAEIERIFTKTWVFVAHDSEIPNAGDYVLRRIGVDPVIVSRGNDGGITVMSNHCRHRGTQVCQSDQGNAASFTCPYHGWTYGSNGKLLGVPLAQRAYGGTPDPAQWSLLQAPKVDSYRGFIFASLSADVPSLPEWLGGAAWMIDTMVGLHPGGMRVAGPPDRYVVNGDWKSAAENFSGDGYHIPTLHQSVEEVHMAMNFIHNCEISRAYEFENGHSFLCHAWTQAIMPEWTYGGYPPDVKAQFDVSALDEKQRHIASEEPVTVCTIFPNLSYIRAFTGMPDYPPFTVAVPTSFRQWQPIAPGKIELWNWSFVWNFQDDESARKDYVANQYTFGSAGMFEQDDTVVWESTARAGASPWLRQAKMPFHYQMGDHPGVDDAPDPNWTGPGIRRPTGYGEHTHKNFLRQWLKAMKGGH